MDSSKSRRKAEKKPKRKTMTKTKTKAGAKRKQTEKPSHQSEELYRLLAENSLDMISRHKPDSTFLYVSPACRALFGYEPEELLGRKAFDFMHPDDVDQVMSITQQVVVQGSSETAQYRHLTKDGHYIWVECTGRVIKDPRTGKMSDIICVVRDITERKQSEETLRQERDFAESLIETAQTIVLVLDTKGHIVRFNPFMEKLSGYRLEEVQGKEWFSTFLPQRDQDRIRSLFEKAVNGIHTRGNVNPIVTKDGREIEIEWYSTTLKDAEGNVLGVVAIGQDITERKRAEARQQLAIEVLAALNDPKERSDTIRDILLLIKNAIGFDAVAIRLREGDDFPYYQQNGFPPDFVEAERYLCERDAAGNIVRDTAGNPVLECMCGNILCGRTDPQYSFFTENGSFWTNSTSELLASATGEDRQAQTRNRCHGEGYETVALIPLRSGAEIIGLLQLNDKRRGMLTLDTVRFFEGLGHSIGIALTRKQAEEALAASEATARALLDAHMDVAVLVNPDGCILGCNNQFRELAGKHLSELMGLFAWELMAPNDAERRKALLKKALEKKKTIQVETSARGQWFDTLVSPILDAEGNVQKIAILIQNITEQKEARQKLLDYQEKLQALTTELTLTEEREQKQIAAFLHDELCQNLVGIRLKFAQLEFGSPGFEEQIEEIESLIEHTIKNTYSMTFELRPPILNELGLVPAIEWLGEKSGQEHELQFKFTDDGLPKPISEETQHVLFRAVRELLNNIFRHAQASKVTIRTGRANNNIRISVEDDGKGFDASTRESLIQESGGFGLFNIRERIEFIEGRIEIVSVPGRGTRIILSAPIAPDEHHPDK